MNDNYGVLEVEVKDTDYVAGLLGLQYEMRLLSGDWSPYLAGKERQSPPETMSCVSFSCNHCVDTQMNWLIETGQFTKEALDYFKSAGYLAHGYFNTSDRWLAIQSGTTRQGNGLQKVLDTMRHKGLLPEVDLPFGGTTWDEYHNPKVITQAMNDKAKKILDYIKIEYEWIFTKDDGSNVGWTLARHLKHGTVQLCIPICASFRNGDSPAGTCDLRTAQHAVMAYAEDGWHRILDQYEPYKRDLAKDYPLLYGLKIVVSSKVQPKNEEFHKEHPELSPDVTPAQYTLRQALFNYFKQLFTKVRGILGSK